MVCNRMIEIDGFIFEEYGKPDVKTLILGLPDVGLVGAIASLHIIRELKMQDTIGIDSPTMLPPVSVIMNGQPKLPMRIYSRDGIGVLVTDVPILPPGIPAFSSALVKYARSIGVERLISVTGLGNPARIEMEKPKLYAITNNDEAGRELLEGLGAESVNHGILVGPYALILKESRRVGLLNLVLMVDAFIDIPDPGAAAVAVEALNKILNLNVDVKKLLEEGDKIKLRLKELMNETKNMMAKMGKSYEYRPTLLYT
ncbi:MAG: proteasome assembly chaperone family protein [Desulfurococcales archaeon]|nr:proteasome assembly chaperone family protein [Desulfurococcales archaeon]